MRSSPLLRESQNQPLVLVSEDLHWLEHSDGAHPASRQLPARVPTGVWPDVPTTVQAVLAARIDRLSPDDKRLLQSAAAIGKDVPLALLEAISDLTEVRRGLGQLQATEFVYEARLFPDLAYTFKHALTHTVAYQSLLKSTRQQLHNRIARALEERFTPIAAAQPELLAHHLTECGRLEEATTVWERAGDHAVSRSAFVEGIAHFRRGLEILETLPASTERARHKLRIHLKLGRLLTAARGYNAPEILAPPR